MLILISVMLAILVAGILVWLGAYLQHKIQWLHDPVFIPSTNPAVSELLSLLPKPTRTFQRAADLGSGDGKLVIALAQKGFQVDGIEINPWLVWRAQSLIKQSGLEKTAHIYQQNVWTTNFKKYHLVVLYFSEHLMAKLAQKLRAELQPGAVVISNTFRLPGWKVTKRRGNVFRYDVP